MAALLRLVKYMHNAYCYHFCNFIRCFRHTIYTHTHTIYINRETEREKGAFYFVFFHYFHVSLETAQLNLSHTDTFYMQLDVINYFGVNSLKGTEVLHFLKQEHVSDFTQDLGVLLCNLVSAEML